MSRALTFERYAADAFLVVGGAAALLLQMGDPVIARGVAAHSAFARDPLGRLRRTLGYVYAIALGTEQQRRRAAERVDRTHAGIPGVPDPERQLWVAATLARLGTTTHELLHGPLDPLLADEIHARAAAIGTILQLPPDAWPPDRATFAAYWNARVATLEVGDEARAVARDILRPRSAPLWARAAMPLIRSLTAGLLPPRVRDAYGLALHPRRFATAAAAVRVLARLTPRALRELPARRLLAGL